MSSLKTRVKKLTRKQKLDLLDLKEERHRREIQKPSNYKPNEGQTPVHKCDKKLRCVFSGNGAGKTALAVNEVIWAAKGYNPVRDEYTPVPIRIVVLLDHPEKVADVWLPEIRKWTSLTDWTVQKRGKPYVTQMIAPNGSEILFMFHQQEPTLFESIEVDFVVADEPPPRHIYVALRRGGRRKGRESKYLMIGTPISGSWLRIEIYDPWEKGELPDTECFRFGTIVNEKNLASGYIESFSRVLNEKEKRIRLYGEFFDLEGLALAHLFSHETHVIRYDNLHWNTSWPVVVAVDPHASKPHHALMLGVDPDNRMYVLKEFSSKAIARDFARQLKKFYQGYRVIDLICDSLGSAENTAGEGFKSFIQVLNEEGVRIRATTWDDKCDEDFIERIRTVLSVPEEPDNFGKCIPQLRIVEGNDGIIKDIENVQWVKYRNLDVFKPKLDISHKDFLACLKYALASNLTFTKTKSKIYRRIKGAETYGISSNKPNAEYYKRKFGVKAAKVSGYRKKKSPVESWKEW
jgi:hypothetical protein